MGLDMYAYVGQKGQYKEYYENANWDEQTKDFVSPVSKPNELWYWRKHPNLHGWMEQLWIRKMKEAEEAVNDDSGWGSFNGIELELTWDDIDELEKDIRGKRLPTTTGFFFGNPSDEYYFDEGLKFCIAAKAELFLGQKVFYNSSW